MIISTLKKIARRFINRDEAFLKKLRKQGAKIGKHVQIIDRDKFLYEPWIAYLIEIEDRVVISAGVRFVNHDSSYANVFGDLPIKYGKIIIGENSYIGVNSIILPGIEIGKNCLIGAGSVVNRNIPPNSLAAGNPVRIIKPINDGKDKYIQQITKHDVNVDFIDLGGSFSQMFELYDNKLTDHILNTVNNYFLKKNIKERTESVNNTSDL